MTTTPLGRAFYERDVEAVARDLLGCYLVRRRGGSLVGGRLVEVEAYGGPGDPGSHADRAPNGRARIMFGPAGLAYVYFTYGMHFCMNAVTGREGEASAVLLRALEPVWGMDEMRAAWLGRERRPPPERLLGSGPGRLCFALGVDRSHNGVDLTDGDLVILPGDRIRACARGVRVGLSLDDGREWRFWDPESSSVSRSGRAARARLRGN